MCAGGGGGIQKSVIDSRAMSQREYTVVTEVYRARSTGASQDREDRQGLHTFDRTHQNENLKEIKGSDCGYSSCRRMRPAN